MYDNYDMFEMNELAYEQELQKLPVCDFCDEPIQDEFFYRIGNLSICEKCLKESCLERTEDFTEAR